MKPLSPTKLDLIIQMLHQRVSHRDINASTGASLGAISKIRDHYCPDLPKAPGGRPQILSSANIQYATTLIKRKKAKNAVQAARALSDVTNTIVHPQNVRRALKTSGLVAKRKKKKPMLTKRHRQARLEFAEKHQHFTIEDWKQYIWSDEVKVNLFGSDGEDWAWVETYNNGHIGLSSQAIQPTVKHGGGNIMVWGNMSWEGVGYACRIEGKMDADLYIQILEDELQESMKYYDLDWEDYIFQQDNDPKHTAKKVKKWFEDHGIRVLKWPAQSPDLNPIEHLWSHVKRQLAKYENPPKGVTELWERFEKEWNDIPKSVCQNLIESMPRRVQAVIKAKGGSTKY